MNTIPELGSWDPVDYAWNAEKLLVTRAGLEPTTAGNPCVDNNRNKPSKKRSNAAVAGTGDPPKLHHLKQHRGTIACQVPGCAYDLTSAKAFYQKCGVCPEHANQLFLELGGDSVYRFCQQCGRIHDISYFDGNKRSCRDQLNKHNVARRKERAAARERRGNGRGKVPVSSNDSSIPRSRVSAQSSPGNKDGPSPNTVAPYDTTVSVGIQVEFAGQASITAPRGLRSYSVLPASTLVRCFTPPAACNSPGSGGSNSPGDASPVPPPTSFPGTGVCAPACSNLGVPELLPRNCGLAGGEGPGMGAVWPMADMHSRWPEAQSQRPRLTSEGLDQFLLCEDLCLDGVDLEMEQMHASLLGDVCLPFQQQELQFQQQPAVSTVFTPGQLPQHSATLKSSSVQPSTSGGSCSDELAMPQHYVHASQHASPAHHSDDSSVAGGHSFMSQLQPQGGGRAAMPAQPRLLRALQLQSAQSMRGSSDGVAGPLPVSAAVHLNTAAQVAPAPAASRLVPLSLGGLGLGLDGGQGQSTSVVTLGVPDDLMHIMDSSPKVAEQLWGSATAALQEAREANAASQSLNCKLDAELALLRICIKLHGCTPSQLPDDMHARLAQWVQGADAHILQGFIRPGCVHLTLDVVDIGTKPLAQEECLLQRLLAAHRGTEAACLQYALGNQLLQGRKVAVQGASRVVVLEDAALSKDCIVSQCWTSAGAPPTIELVEPLCIISSGSGPVKLRAHGRHLAGAGVRVMARSRGQFLDAHVEVLGDEMAEVTLSAMPKPGLLLLECCGGQPEVVSPYKPVVVLPEGDAHCAAAAELQALQEALKQMQQPGNGSGEAGAAEGDGQACSSWGYDQLLVAMGLLLQQASEPAASAAEDSAGQLGRIAAHQVRQTQDREDADGELFAVGSPGDSHGSTGSGYELFGRPPAPRSDFSGDSAFRSFEEPQAQAQQQQQQPAATSMLLQQLLQQELLRGMSQNQTRRRILGAAALSGAFAGRLYAAAQQLLSECCCHGWVATAQLVVGLLLQQGHALPGIIADCTRSDSTLLHNAVQSGSLAMVQAALRWAETCGHVWNWAHPGGDGLSPLHLAAALEDGGAVAAEALKSSPGACVAWFAASAGPPQSSPAHFAASSGLAHLNVAALRSLMRHGALVLRKKQLGGKDQEHGRGGDRDAGGSGSSAGSSAGTAAGPPPQQQQQHACAEQGQQHDEQSQPRGPRPQEHADAAPPKTAQQQLISLLEALAPHPSDAATGTAASGTSFSAQSLGTLFGAMTGAGEPSTAGSQAGIIHEQAAVMLRALKGSVRGTPTGVLSIANTNISGSTNTDVLEAWLLAYGSNSSNVESQSQSTGGGSTGAGSTGPGVADAGLAAEHAASPPVPAGTDAAPLAGSEPAPASPLQQQQQQQGRNSPPGEAGAHVFPAGALAAAAASSWAEALATHGSGPASPAGSHASCKEPVLGPRLPPRPASRQSSSRSLSGPQIAPPADTLQAVQDAAEQQQGQPQGGEGAGKGEEEQQPKESGVGQKGDGVPGSGSGGDQGATQGGDDEKPPGGNAAPAADQAAKQAQVAQQQSPLLTALGASGLVLAVMLPMGTFMALLAALLVATVVLLGSSTAGR